MKYWREFFDRVAAYEHCRLVRADGLDVVVADAEEDGLWVVLDRESRQNIL